MCLLFAAATSCRLQSTVQTSSRLLSLLPLQTFSTFPCLCHALHTPSGKTGARDPERLQFDCWQCPCGAPSSCCILQLCRLHAPHAWRQRLAFGCMEHPADALLPCCMAAAGTWPTRFPISSTAKATTEPTAKQTCFWCGGATGGLALGPVGWLAGWLVGCVHAYMSWSGVSFLTPSCVECQLRACARRASSLLLAAAAMLPLNSNAGGVPLDPLSPPLVGPQR